MHLAHGQQFREGAPSLPCHPALARDAALSERRDVESRQEEPPSLPPCRTSPRPSARYLKHSATLTTPHLPTAELGPGPRGPQHGSASGTTGTRGSARLELQGRGTMQQKSLGTALSWKPLATNRRMGKQALICHLFSSFFNFWMQLKAATQSAPSRAC